MDAGPEDAPMAAPPRRIVVGYDGTDGSRRALEACAELMGYGSALTVVAVVSEGDSGGRDVLASARELLLQKLVTAEYVHRIGDPVGQLVEAAAEVGADLLVVGRRSGVDASRHEPGSVSAGVVRLAPCDVLVVG
jgi:nucleotide-binding universal stress UspA family protein